MKVYQDESKDVDDNCRNNCTYCGGGIEDNYPPAGIAAALLLFPIGIVLCCILKERQCVKCNRTAA